MRTRLKKEEENEGIEFFKRVTSKRENLWILIIFSLFTIFVYFGSIYFSEHTSIFNNSNNDGKQSIKKMDKTKNFPIFIVNEGIEKVFIKNYQQEIQDIQNELEIIKQTHNFHIKNIEKKKKLNLFKNNNFVIYDDNDNENENENMNNEKISEDLLFEDDFNYWHECENDKTNFFRFYTDLKCYALWINKLENMYANRIDKIEGVMNYEKEKLLPKSEREFKSMSNGGVRMHFNSPSSTLMGYWKPCTLETGHYESYFAEIVSFWIDRILGFYHTPPVIPRYFTRFELFALAHLASISNDRVGDKLAVRKIESILEECGTSESDLFFPVKNNQIDGAEGALVGWSPFPLKTIFGKRVQENFVLFSSITTEEEFEEMKLKFFNNITNNSPVEDKQRALEIISVHLFAMIVGNLRKFDHNLFQAYNDETFHNGPYIYIDNDRSQWVYSAHKLMKSQNTEINPIRRLCLFPKRIIRRLLFLRSENKENQQWTISKWIFKLNQIYRDSLKHQVLFTVNDAWTLEGNINYIADIVDHCAAKHGLENILIEETWAGPFNFPF